MRLEMLDIASPICNFQFSIPHLQSSTTVLNVRSSKRPSDHQVRRFRHKLVLFVFEFLLESVSLGCECSIRAVPRGPL